MRIYKMYEKFYLKWSDYQSNWNKTLHELRKDTEFADVTLISDDKVKFSAHKILLSSFSILFKFILKGNVQANSIIYLSGVNSNNLGFVLDYIYHGEVSIYQEHLDSFLESARQLEIEGLLHGSEAINDNLNEGNEMHQEPEENIEHKIRIVDYYTQDEEKSLATIVKKKNKRPYARASKDEAKIDVGSLTSDEIENKRRELYERTDEGWKCLVCDHKTEGPNSSNMRSHVERHMDGLVFVCNLCNKEFISRNILAKHRYNSHK